MEPPVAAWAFPSEYPVALLALRRAGTRRLACRRRPLRCRRDAIPVTTRETKSRGARQCQPSIPSAAGSLVRHCRSGGAIDRSPNSAFRQPSQCHFTHGSLHRAVIFSRIVLVEMLVEELMRAMARAFRQLKRLGVRSCRRGPSTGLLAELDPSILRSTRTRANALRWDQAKLKA